MVTNVRIGYPRRAAEGRDELPVFRESKRCNLKMEVNYVGSYPWLRAGTLLPSHKIIAITDSLVKVVEYSAEL